MLYPLKLSAPGHENWWIRLLPCDNGHTELQMVDRTYSPPRVVPFSTFCQGVAIVYYDDDSCVDERSKGFVVNFSATAGDRIQLDHEAATKLADQLERFRDRTDALNIRFLGS